MNRRVLPLIIGSLLLPLGCGGDGEPTGPSFATLVITTTSLPNAVATVAYNETLVATGGDGNYTWSITVGSPPTGLSLNTSTGLISGTPTVVETQNLTVEVTSGDGQTASQQLTITVDAQPVLLPSELCSDYPDYAIATFEDANLEAEIRAALSVDAQEALTCGLLSGVTDIFAHTSGIVSLVGIQNLTSLMSLRLINNSISDISVVSGLTNLVSLDFEFNSISDISALSGLTSLTFLRLSGNLINDISVLSGLTSLTLLRLFDNSINDISPLSGLTSLTSLELGQNSISDISAVSGLTSLASLWLYQNSISDISALTSLTSLFLDSNSIIDISALSGLTSLTTLSLHSNPDLSNIQPLLDNTGLGAVDTVDLRFTNVSCTDVAALEAKGVTVTSDCP